MQALVTGAAGFIGSTLSERLVADGWSVTGIDCFTDYYEESTKRSNLDTLSRAPGFELVEADLRTTDLDALLAPVDVVFHLAGQPGVRLSWAQGFPTYVEMNVNATQRLLEAARATELHRFVYASSSSVYGNARLVPTPETEPTRPHSPYGVTKLAGELLCSAYAANYGLHAVSLRYFTVYGPRQRPDMAIHRLVEAALDGRSFPLYGDGSQIRDFTYVDDIVNATVMAATSDAPPATVVNAAGGGSVPLSQLIDLVGEVVGQPVQLDRQSDQPGDVRATGGDIEHAHEVLGWSPLVKLAEGVARQAAWHRARRES